jgi:hypothetical protein
VPSISLHVVQLPENQLLQFVGGVSLLGVYAGLDKQGLRIYLGLFEQQAKAVVFG